MEKSHDHEISQNHGFSVFFWKSDTWPNPHVTHQSTNLTFIVRFWPLWLSSHYLVHILCFFFVYVWHHFSSLDVYRGMPVGGSIVFPLWIPHQVCQCTRCPLYVHTLILYIDTSDPPSGWAWGPQHTLQLWLPLHQLPNIILPSQAFLCKFPYLWLSTGLSYQLQKFQVSISNIICYKSWCMERRRGRGRYNTH